MKGLNQLYFLKIEIQELKDEINSITELSSSQITGMPHSNGINDPTSQYFLKKQRLIEKLNRKLEKYIDELTRIEEIIDGIDDVEIRTIARLRFIKNLKWEEIGKEINLDRSACYKKLNKYLKNKFLGEK